MPMFGTIIKYDRIKRYGFVLPDDESLPDHFFVPKFLADPHTKLLMVGWKVEFDSVEAATGFQAHHLRVIAKPIVSQYSAVFGGDTQSVPPTLSVNHAQQIILERDPNNTVPALGSRGGVK